MNPIVLSVAAAALVLSAGCVAPAQPSPPPTAPDPSTAQPASGAAPAEDGVPEATAPLTLFLLPDMTLGTEPSAAEGSATIGDAVNSPEATEYPEWAGALPRPLRVGADGIGLVFYVTSNTASAAVGPAFLGQLPGFFVHFQVGEKAYRAAVDGPPALVAGQVVTVEATLEGPPLAFPAGTPVELTIAPIYTHVTMAAEVRFPMGPDHPARLEAPGA